MTVERGLSRWLSVGVAKIGVMISADRGHPDTDVAIWRSGTIFRFESDSRIVEQGLKCRNAAELALCLHPTWVEMQ